MSVHNQFLEPSPYYIPANDKMQLCLYYPSDNTEILQFGLIGSEYVLDFDYEQEYGETSVRMYSPDNSYLSYLKRSQTVTLNSLLPIPILIHPLLDCIYKPDDLNVSKLHILWIKGLHDDKDSKLLFQVGGKGEIGTLNNGYYDPCIKFDTVPYRKSVARRAYKIYLRDQLRDGDSNRRTIISGSSFHSGGGLFD